MDNNTIKKGDIAEKLFELECLKRGISFFIPGNSSTRCDYLIYHEGCYKRVQIKYITATNKCGGQILISFTKNQNGRKTKDGKPLYLKYTQSEIDIFLVYCPTTSKWYLIPLADYEHQRGMTLRISDDKPTNNKEHGIKYASKFEW